MTGTQTSRNYRYTRYTRETILCFAPLKKRTNLQQIHKRVKTNKQTNKRTNKQTNKQTNNAPKRTRELLLCSSSSCSRVSRFVYHTPNTNFYTAAAAAAAGYRVLCIIRQIRAHHHRQNHLIASTANITVRSMRVASNIGSHHPHTHTHITPTRHTTTTPCSFCQTRSIR